ncbi:IS3 family transposase [Paenibacillus xylanexedens]|uniref:IS3 family transposase n=1 Tax=Paenibacillus xylanexedens TaxID=528191 RepID=UPI000F5331CB|nr:IS3 family transposase [Paenibacillus xylanexedens]
MPAKKGQTFNQYSEETKKEAVRLRLEEGWTYSRIMEKFGIKSESQIITWVRKSQNGESFEDYRGRWTKKHFSSAEEENTYLKTQVEYLKKAQSEFARRGKLDFEARYQSVREISKWAPVVWLCKIAEISRAGYYKWKKSIVLREKRADRDADLKAHILGIHRLRPYFGYKRMRTALGKEGFVVNHKKVRRLMRELQIRSVIRKKRPFAGRKPSVLFRNVLNREFSAAAPQQKLVTDITYVRIGHDFAYLSVVMDLYNNEIVAWELSERNDLKLVMDTVKKLKCGPTLLHSDQGFQYTTQSYAKLLEEKKLTGSHSRRGNCYDNACIESFFSHLKTEKLYLEKPQNLEQARNQITEYIFVYNKDRFQNKLGDLSPIEFREKVAA